MNFATGLERYGDSAALVFADGTSCTYRELAQRADAVFDAPGAPGRPRTLVAIECSNVAASVCAYLGALRRGHPALLVDGQLAQDLREQLYARFGVACAWSVDGQWRALSGPAPAVHGDLALLLSTSGSTGSPKLVRLSLGNLQANAEAIAGYLALDAGERPITTLPLHYSYGLSVLNSHLACGASIALSAESVTSAGFWNHFRAAGATSLAGVPATYAMLRQLRFERMALPTLRTMTQAGGRMAPELAGWFGELAASRGQRFFVMYGQTEATARISYVPPERLLDKPDSIGIAIPGGALDLVDDAGNVLSEAGVVGQLRYRGPNVMLGYAEQATDLALPDVQQGSLLTGDLALRDEEGYFHLRGRLKRFIKVFGNRIGLDEVESELRRRGHDVAVTGRDDLLLLALRGTDPDGTAVVELAALAASLYRLHPSAIRAVRVDTFPLSAAGKILYMDLLERHLP